jgi:glucose/mannose transport system substrate-binding protein
MKKRHLVLFLVMAVALIVPAAVEAGGGRERARANQLEIFSWWTAGGEAEGLQALIDLYNAQYPDVEVINATVAGGAGAQAKAVLASRMQGGNPPDSFQVHAGQGIVATWVVEGFMEPVTFILEDNGWLDDYPQGVIDIISYQGEIYSIPVNIHRSNVMWYNKKVFADNNLTPPRSLAEFFRVAEALQARGVTPLALGGSDGWEPTHLLESVLLAELGADAYRGLWDGRTRWDGDRTRQALTSFTRILQYINRDQAAITNIDAAQYVAEGRAAMTVMGDWVHGYYLSIGLTPDVEYGWIPFPGTGGNFLMLSDTFGLPKDVPNPENVRRWLTLVASREGQDAFNPIKGSIPARTDADRSLYDKYLLSAMDDFETNAIVPSVAHGAAASESWITRINDVVNVLVTDRNVDRAAREFQQLANQYAR